MRKRKSDKGMITLEACVFMTIFSLVVLILISLFPLMMGHSIVSNSLIQSAQSISLESYTNSEITVFQFADGNSNISDWVSGGFFNIARLISNWSSNVVEHDNVESFNDRTNLVGEQKKPFKGVANLTQQKLTEINAAIPNIARERFYAFLSGGDEEEADAILKKVYIENGIDGLNFSESKRDGNDLLITVKYTVKYQVFLVDIGGEVEQTIRVRLWK